MRLGVPGSLQRTVLTSPQVTTAAGLCCLVGVGWMLADGGPLLVAVAFLLGARAFLEQRAQPWFAASAPVWAAVVVAGAWRAGSGDLGDIQGAHAVLGVGLGHGRPLAVASMWFVVLAGVAVAGLPRTVVRLTRGGQPSWPARLAWVVHGVLLTAVVAGPSVRSVGDVVPWLSAAALLAAAVVVAARVGPSERLLVARTAAGIAVVLGALA